MGLDEIEDGVALHDRTRIKMMKGVLGSRAKEALEGVLDATIVTYPEAKKVVLERFLPQADDVQSICVLRRCTMHDDENTKSYVNRLRALASRLPTLPDEWRTKFILSSLRMHHKNGNERDLLTEKMPETIVEAERLAESYEVRPKDKANVDRFNAALGGVSNSMSVDGVARGYWTNNSATGSTGRGCSNPSCSLRRCKGNPCLMMSLQCHACGQKGHFANSCPQKPQNNMQKNTSQYPPQRFMRGRFSRGVPQRGRGRMIGEAYPGYMEQMEQQQFDAGWQLYRSSRVPSMTSRTKRTCPRTTCNVLRHTTTTRTDRQRPRRRRRHRPGPCRDPCIILRVNCKF
jgi:hypothetical protein